MTWQNQVYQVIGSSHNMAEPSLPSQWTRPSHGTTKSAKSGDDHAGRVVWAESSAVSTLIIQKYNQNKFYKSMFKVLIVLPNCLWYKRESIPLSVSLLICIMYHNLVAQTSMERVTRVLHNLSCHF